MLLLYGPPWIWKSTIWAEYARITWQIHIDTDSAFIQKYGDISQFIWNYWEKKFREKEWEILEENIHRWDGILTLGWWSLLLPSNQELANKSGNVITLMADIETIIDRISKDTQTHRPLAHNETNIRKLMLERYTHYTSQKIIYIVWESESPENIVDKIWLLQIR